MDNTGAAPTHVTEPVVMVHRNSGMRYIAENWTFFTARFKNLEEACAPVLSMIETDGFRRMLSDIVESKARHGAVHTMLCNIPQARTTIHRPFAPNNIWSDANLSAPGKKDLEACAHWSFVKFADLIRVRALLAEVNEQITGANEFSSTAANVLGISKLSDAPQHQCVTLDGTAITVGGPGDVHNVLFWIRPLLAPAPALLPYMSETFVPYWEKNPLATENLFRNETPRLWHHPTEGPMLGASAFNLLDEVSNICKRWEETQNFTTFAPADVRKHHRQRYPDTKKP